MGHQNDLKPFVFNGLKGLDGQEGVVDCPQPVGGDDDDIALQSCDQIPHRKALGKGHQQTAYPLNEQALAADGHAFNLLQHVR